MIADLPAAVGATSSGKQAILANAAVCELTARLILDSNGVIRDFTASAEALFKTRRSALIRKHVSRLLPQLAELDLLPNCEINPQLQFLCSIGFRFQAVNFHGERFASAVIVKVLDSSGYRRLSLVVTRAEVSDERWLRTWGRWS